MSSKDMARRAAVEVAFDGVDITNTIVPYLLSLSYTDNEEDETDDLQIKLQDRDLVWLTKWLGATVDAAATVDPNAPEQPQKYTVNATNGLNVRAGPGTSYAIYGVLVNGSTVEVSETSGTWGKISYSGKTAYVSTNYLEEAKDEQNTKGSGPASMLKIQAVIARRNWNGDGKDDVLDCGQFELDNLDVSGPPNTVTIKASSLPYTSQIRQTKKSKAWESYTLSRIQKEVAASNGMACLYLASTDPFYERVEQYKESDIAFLSTLCHNAGISLKATNNILVMYDQAEYEAKDPVFTLKREAGGYEKYKLDVGTADTQYSSCRVSYVDPMTGQCIEGIAKVEDYKEDAKNNQQLEVSAKVANAAEAKALAEKRLRLHNKFTRGASFTVPGNPILIAGVTVMLSGWGPWDGKYIVSQAVHTVSGSGGYSTQINLRRVLEGY